ncbi:hypothetical protein LTR37_011136 [Vermiconidia calcicola]|uniref:Uncharacterized protein n=1 Tax=Vermiconidia calcicola TaxID=1690605 RepID=A0ACC3N2V1_9PEZI|nr:hypothetical protein LTR37_011136 [Vermiconidia calcicola]
MKLTSTIFALVAVVSVSVAGAAVSAVPFSNLDKRQSASPEILNNLSYLFGWQMVGAAGTLLELISACNDISTLGHGKWAEMGLFPSSIIVPICGTPEPNATAARINSVRYTTGMFMTHLLSSFTGTDNFNYICTSLNFDLVDQFAIDSQALSKAVCQRAGAPLQPIPATTPPDSKTSPQAVKAAQNRLSVLYANILAAGAYTVEDLSDLCEAAPEHEEGFNAQFLNGMLVRRWLCDFTKPITVPDAKTAVVAWTSRYFVAVVESISTVNNWLEWLCKNVDFENMATVGLDPNYVTDQICADARGSEKDV